MQENSIVNCIYKRILKNFQLFGWDTFLGSFVTIVWDGIIDTKRSYTNLCGMVFSYFYFNITLEKLL